MCIRDRPCAALLVSGGHTSLLAVNDITRDIVELGATIDDAAGEAYDKVARLLGLAYPGGPVIDRVAADGDPRAIAFPRGLTAGKDQARHRFDYSFSGLKTAVARWVEIRRRDGEDVPVADVAASFQEAVCDVLTAKAVDACEYLGADHLLLGGGVAANSRDVYKRQRVAVQKFGTFLSGMIMPNIPALIAWGILTMFFIPAGFTPNAAISTIVGPMIHYLLPVSYTHLLTTSH